MHYNKMTVDLIHLKAMQCHVQCLSFCKHITPSFFTICTVINKPQRMHIPYHPNYSVAQGNNNGKRFVLSIIK